MDPKEMRSYCTQSCREMMEECVIGESSYYTCDEKLSGCLSHCGVGQADFEENA